MDPHLRGAAELGGDEAGLVGELGATFDHVAIAGRRIRDMLPLWRDTLGGRFVVGADNPAVGWRAVRLELSGVWCLELIEPLPGTTCGPRSSGSRPMVTSRSAPTRSGSRCSSNRAAPAACCCSSCGGRLRRA